MLSLIFAGSALAASSHYWLGGTGNWSDDSNWDIGEPDTGSTAYINSGNAIITESGEYVHYNLYIGRTATDNGTVTMQSGDLRVGYPEYIGSGGKGLFTQISGVHNAMMSIVVGRLYGSEGTYDLQGGVLNVAGITIGENGTGTFTQSGGIVNCGSFLFIANKWVGSSDSIGKYIISGGELNIELYGIRIGYDGTEGTFDITNSAAKITINGVLHFGPVSVFKCVSDGKITLTGEDGGLENRQINESNLEGLLSLNLIFSDSVNEWQEFEVAGEDMGADGDGYYDNFALGTLTIGEPNYAQVQLIDIVDNNNRGGVGGIDEALYVINIVLKDGCQLDLNGKHLYYCDMELGSGAGFINGTPIEISGCGFKSDLIITDTWADSEIIWYQVRNIGDINCPAGHTTALYVNSNIVATDVVNVELSPGGRANRLFGQYSWQCSQLADDILVSADENDDIAEKDENNNILQETWFCDNNAPEITSGPTVSNITTDSAKISWTTDEDANSLVLYDTRADALAYSVSDPGLNIEHEIILNNLIPGTTYMFSVSSTDESGNMVTSKRAYFNTHTLPDNTQPNITFFARASSKFPMQFSVDANDNIDVDRVEFMIDGELFEIDYFAPYMCIIDPARLGYTTSEFDGDHTVTATVIDQAGNTTQMASTTTHIFDCNKPACEIIEPEYGVIIDTDTDLAPDINIPIDVCASVFTGWTMGWARDFHGEPVRFQTSAPVHKVDFIYNDVVFDTTYGADVGEVHSSEFNVNGKPLGEHTVWVRATTAEGCTASDRTYITVQRRRPEVRLASRTVTTTGTCLNVSLRLENTGDATAYLDSLTDTLIGFQTAHANNPAFDAIGEYLPADRLCITQIDFDPCVAIIASGASYDLNYLVVPVLYPGIEEYEIGLETRLDYHDISESYSSNRPIPCTWVNPYSGRMRLEEAVTQCCREADYLVVTNPKNLYDLYNNDEVHMLLSKAADLASLRAGVLGYYYSIGNATTNYDRNDRIAVGHLFGDYRQELWLSDNEDDRIRCYHAGGEYWINDGNLPQIITDLHENDGFAFGNVYGFTPGGAPDAQNEFVVANGHSTYSFPHGNLGDITWYSYDAAIQEFIQDEFYTDYEGGDGFSVGNVLVDTIADEDEVLIANADGTVQIHQSRSSAPTLSMPTVFESGDFFLTADILGDFRHELIIGHKENETIYIYDGANAAGVIIETIVLSDLNGDDDIAVGDLIGDLKHEIVIADASADDILVYTYNSSSLSMICTEVFDIEYYRRDALAVADFTHALRSEILILRGQNDHNRRTGQVEIISLEGGDNPGDKWALDDLIDEGGEWAGKLDPNWAREGYLLIIGEIQIIPAFSESYELSGTRRIEASDRTYANTAGEAKYPELCIGRIIGNNASILTKPIQTSLDVLRGDKDFSNNFGFSASGHRRGSSGDSDPIDFTPERRSIAEKLRDEGFIVSEAHEPDATEFFAQANCRNAIYLAGHGSIGGWDDVNTADVDANFDTCGSAPLIYAASCKTGRYMGRYSFAESFLNHGAGSYIGATENAIGRYVIWLANRFFDRFYVGREIGHALKHAKRDLQGAGSYEWDRPYERYNASVFHLFGDPKLALSPSGLMAAAQTMDSAQLLSSAQADITGPVSSLQLSIPDFNVISSSGYQYVSIPGGGALLVPDMPEVPAYTVTIDFLPGYKVQDVTMTERSTVSSGIGLNLTTVNLAVRQQQGISQGQQPPNGPEWYPERAFNWQSFNEPNGHTSLVVTVYPFYYNANTTQYMFYQSYNFDIDYTYSDITIHSLRSDKNVYSPGDMATIEAYLLNSSQQPTDVIAEAVITTALGEPVYGWPIRTLKNFSGLASCSWSIDTTLVELNDYIARLTLKTPNTNVLDNTAIPFSVGDTIAEITSHTIAPECWTTDDNITISTVLTNTGDLPLTGTLYVEVHRTDGSLATQYTKDFNDLPSNSTVTSNIVWWATLPKGECAIVAYSLYEGQSTPVSILPEVAITGSGDLNNDGIVNFPDYAILADLWKQSNTTADIAPIVGDCFTDYLDLRVLVDNWLYEE